MPATAVCWSKYEFFKFLLYTNKRKTVSLASPVVAAPASQSITYEDNKLSKPLHHFHAMNKEPTPTVSPSHYPRELPAMSSVGLVYAHHTMHDYNPASSQLTDFPRST